MAEPMTQAVSNHRASGLWIALLTAASAATSLMFACATPFPALAAIAAIHLRPRAAVTLMVAAWVVSQAVGFGLLGYPREAGTLLTGCAIGTAAVTSVLAALAAAGGVDRRSRLVRVAIAYVAGFVTFKLAIALWSPIMGHGGAALSIEIMARQFVRNAAILGGLMMLYRGLTAIGVPAAPPARPVAI